MAEPAQTKQNEDGVEDQGLTNNCLDCVCSMLRTTYLGMKYVLYLGFLAMKMCYSTSTHSSIGCFHRTKEHFWDAVEACGSCCFSSYDRKRVPVNPYKPVFLYDQTLHKDNTNVPV